MNAKSITRRWVMVSALAIGLIAVSGCHTDMWRQSKIHKPYQQSDFFVDGQSARPPVPGTVARGELKVGNAFYTGMENGKLAATIPAGALARFDSTRDMLARGQERYNAVCAPCHGVTGDGMGMIAERGLILRRGPASYYSKRLRGVPDGHIFNVITNGFGIMYSYASRVEPRDRWAIVAYVRALQASNPTITSEHPATDNRRNPAGAQPGNGQATNER